LIFVQGLNIDLGGGSPIPGFRFMVLGAGCPGLQAMGGATGAELRRGMAMVKGVSDARGVGQAIGSDEVAPADRG
jgi:hypothetical protein